MEMEELENPMFGSDSFRPSLQVIEEGEREASSSYVERKSESSHEAPSKTMNNASSSTSTMQHHASSSSATSGTESSTQQDNGNKTESKRLSRLPSLSRMIRTKSGRGFNTNGSEEEKCNEDDVSEHRATMKKRASLLGIFNNKS